MAVQWQKSSEYQLMVSQQKLQDPALLQGSGRQPEDHGKCLTRFELPLRRSVNVLRGI